MGVYTDPVYSYSEAERRWVKRGMWPSDDETTRAEDVAREQEVEARYLCARAGEGIKIDASILAAVMRCGADTVVFNSGRVSERV